MRCDDGVECLAGRALQHVARTLAGAVAKRGVGLDDDHLEPGEPEDGGVDPREAELEHPRRRLAELLEDPWGRARGESGR